MGVLEVEAAASEAALPEIRSRGALQVRAIDDGSTGDTKGRFEAVVSVFGNVDSYGDRILKGFFEDSLKEDGFPPIVWTHQWGEPPIGLTEEAEEVEGIELLDGRKVNGLRLLYRLLVDDNQRAREVDAAQRAIGGDGRPALREYSFAFFVKEALTIDDDDFEPVDATHWRDLVKGKIVEAGPTLIGANDQTGPVALLSALSRRRDAKGQRPLGAKAAALLLAAAPALDGLKAGAVLSSANRQRLERAIEALEEILADADKEDDDGKQKNGGAAAEQRRAEVVDLLLDLPAIHVNA